MSFKRWQSSGRTFNSAACVVSRLLAFLNVSGTAVDSLLTMELRP